MVEFQQIVNEYGIFVMLLLAVFSFAAGFVDAVVGGGGLIILPFLLINFPKIPLPAIFGTNKIAAFSGTSIAAMSYAKRIKFDIRLLCIISLAALIAAYFGAQIISAIPTESLKPLILVILVLIAVYTFFKKNLGAHQTKELSFNKQALLGAFFGIVIGFYDGFFGPGTGSFLVLVFVVVLGFEFVKASAYAKVVNCITNIGALIVFIKNGQFILPMALLMVVFNVGGSYWGSIVALKKGNGFIRQFFLVVVGLMIAKFGYDIFKT